ncbi:MAG: hypothetical protein HKP40_11050 [Litoreibacter sp.]|nr:hypothetical protein [Litoreibacter sp.]
MAYQQRVRGILGVTVLLVTVAVVYAKTEDAGEPAKAIDLETGETLFEARCAICHTHDALRDLTGAMTTEEDFQRVDTHLKRHYAPDDEARARILFYLAVETAAQSAR